MTLKKLALAGALLTPLFFAQPAHAGDYCREYQKSIVVNGHREQGYGTACQQPDGSWMIVNTSGTVDPFDELRRQNVTLISQQEPVYYNYGPTYQPVTYYPRPVYAHPYYARPYYPRQSTFFFSFGNNDHHDNRWNRNDHDWDHHDNGWHSHH